jgi:four helix bundle protein
MLSLPRRIRRPARDQGSIVVEAAVAVASFSNHESRSQKRKEAIVASIQRFEELECWQVGRQLAQLVYQVTSEVRFGQDPELRAQMREAAVAIVSSIADGFESKAQLIFIERLYQAKSAAGQLRAQAYIALDVHHLEQARFFEIYELADKCGRQLHRLIVYLETQPGGQRIHERRVEYAVTV